MYNTKKKTFLKINFLLLLKRYLWVYVTICRYNPLGNYRADSE